LILHAFYELATCILDLLEHATKHPNFNSV